MALHPLFIRQIEELFPDESSQLLEAIETEATISIRINLAKTGANPKDIDRVPWCEGSYYLKNHEAFTFDPLFHAGLYYVQDASSMIVNHIIKKLIDKPIKYLDLCAAPGGKSTAALSALPSGSLMVCNEIIPLRANILKENVTKWGYTNCIVTNNDSAQLGRLQNFFDVVAIDAPCSGEGMFRKDRVAVEQWTPALVTQCANRQREIIDNIWDALVPGGILIYSTCTMNREENESMVEYVESQYEATTIAFDFPAEWGISPGVGGKAGCFRFLPHRVRGEGLFVSVLRKPGDGLSGANNKSNAKRTTASKVPEGIKQWLTGSDRYTFSIAGETISAIDNSVWQDAEYVAKRAKVLSCGVEIGTIKGRNVIPSQALALSTALNRQAFTTAEVGYEQAIAYLRGDVINLEGDVSQGIVLLLYKGASIGFVKHLGNRANNLYPKNWRIRSTHVPEQPTILI